MRRLRRTVAAAVAEHAKVAHIIFLSVSRVDVVTFDLHHRRTGPRRIELSDLPTPPLTRSLSPGQSASRRRASRWHANGVDEVNASCWACRQDISPEKACNVAWRHRCAGGLVVLLRPPLFGSLDLAQVSNAQLGLGLGLGGGLSLLGLSRCLHRRIPELFGLRLRGLR